MKRQEPLQPAYNPAPGHSSQPIHANPLQVTFVTFHPPSFSLGCTQRAACKSGIMASRNAGISRRSSELEFLSTPCTPPLDGPVGLRQRAGNHWVSYLPSSRRTNNLSKS